MGMLANRGSRKPLTQGTEDIRVKSEVSSQCSGLTVGSPSGITFGSRTYMLEFYDQKSEEGPSFDRSSLTDLPTSRATGHITGQTATENCVEADLSSRINAPSSRRSTMSGKAPRKAPVALHPSTVCDGCIQIEQKTGEVWFQISLEPCLGKWSCRAVFVSKYNEWTLQPPPDLRINTSIDELSAEILPIHETHHIIRIRKLSRVTDSIDEKACLQMAEEGLKAADDDRLQNLMVTQRHALRKLTVRLRAEAVAVYEQDTAVTNSETASERSEPDEVTEAENVTEEKDTAEEGK